MNLSVIICSHNPRKEYLDRTLEALKAQTLPKDQWELLLIDNASNEPISEKCNLSWHPNRKHIREETLGKTYALLRGIRESKGENIVIVDDDNVLDPEYLKNALEISISHPWIGCFGGNIVGEFEENLPTWLINQLHLLAIIPVLKEEWCFGKGMKVFKYAPPGAGMVLKSEVAKFYVSKVTHDSARLNLGRKGSSLASAEDADMALTSTLLGYGVGKFPQLKLTHLIPSRRLQLDYVLELSEEMVCSYQILEYLWEGKIPVHKIDLSGKKENMCTSEKILRFYKKIRTSRVQEEAQEIREKFEAAWQKGELKAINEINKVRLSINLQ